MKLFSSFLRMFIVQPALVIFGVALSAMLVTSTGPTQVIENYLHEVARVVELGPAPEGYMNIKTCVEWSDRPLAIDANPVVCDSWNVEAVPIEHIAEKFSWSLLKLYVVAFVLALGGRFLLLGLPDLYILWKRKKTTA